MAVEIQNGSVVQLKSGGPEMTVFSIEGTGEARKVWCEWFVDNKPQQHGFRITSLDLIR